MIKLVQTCGGCPESYDAHKDGEYVGSMRLRHGHFSVECKGKTVYSTDVEDDGIFDFDRREFYLNQACVAIENFLKELGRPSQNYEIVQKEDV